MATEPTRPLVDAGQVARDLGICKSGVYRLAAAGALPSVRLGRRVLFPAGVVVRLAEAAFERTATVETVDER